MKKAIALFLALGLTVSATACGGSTSAPASSAAPAPAAPASSSSTPADSAVDPAAFTAVTMQLSHHNAADQPIHEAFTKWAAMVNEKTGGAVSIDIYPAASLYSSGDAQDAVLMGTLDMCLGDTSLLSSDQPEYALFSLPFLIESYEAADKIVYGEVGKEIDSRLQENLGVVPLGWTWNGFRNMCTSKPIESVADCKGLKLRSPGADIYLDTFNTLGMSPNVISWNEAFTAMQSGIVEGVESTLEAFYTQSFYTLGNNIWLSRHMLSIIGPVINQDKWNSLNEATQQVLLESWAECQKELNNQVIDNEESYQAQLTEAGCNVTQISDRQEIVGLFSDYWAESAENMKAADLLEQIMVAAK